MSSSLILEQIKILEKKKSNGKYWNISNSLGNILEEKVANLNPKNILEIGTSNGYSTLFILSGSKKDAKITTIEIDLGRFNEAKEVFQKVDINSQITQINSDVISYLESLNDQKFDFVFLDAAHKNYFNVIKILRNKNLFSKNHTIIADNIISHKYMKEEYVLPMSEFYNNELIEVDSGFLISTSKF